MIKYASTLKEFPIASGMDRLGRHLILISFEGSKLKIIGAIIFICNPVAGMLLWCVLWAGTCK